MLHKELTDKIICAFYNVYNILGYGFLEKVYENALALELQKSDMQVDALKSEHFSQLTNYLKATDKEVGLLLNFGKKPEFKRILLTNDKKRFTRI